MSSRTKNEGIPKFSSPSGSDRIKHMVEIFVKMKSSGLDAQNNLNWNIQDFGCRTGTYPFVYLGIPKYYRKLSNKN
jgi:hypothetical protein